MQIPDCHAKKSLRSGSVLWLLFLAVGQAVANAQTPSGWLIHDINRPQPPIVKPARQALPVPPPSDALVLFDGTDLKNWRSVEGTAARWVVRDGYMESVPDSGKLVSADGFGDVQLHVEWAAPATPFGTGQQRGNSGVFLMGKYELQVLDSFENKTYPDGQAAAIYGQYPPLVNACLPPGEWQSYDIVFRRPRFDHAGNLLSPARITVIHNGIVVHDDRELWGPTSWLQNHPYESHADRLPLALQDHGNPVRYRNIWLRELPEADKPGPASEATRPYVSLPPEKLDKFVGTFQFDDDPPMKVERIGNVLWLQIQGRQPLELVPASEGKFFFRWTAGHLLFPSEQVNSLEFHLGDRTDKAERISRIDSE
ncbi:family 16 glycoside hydrolase [Adhaeretor mobilis]|uniref:3-keto-alpha-glucoside-1,2-lyase/3-keto-2-hydroxy-glucal hydratase domain-containing protein n=1 Tax=Adhaeretor mobilis TaxID=1930276 RepID=A0A517N1E0_9BACT|nr:family 16 glycoside hydrolase [Adhaeretor mobilis]QDT00947.1 hypothetical protein HG15A2_42890 [Adhaeretor mobilis]